MFDKQTNYEAEIEGAFEKSPPKKSNSIPLDQTPKLSQNLRFSSPRDFCPRNVNRILNTETAGVINVPEKKKSEQI